MTARASHRAAPEPRPGLGRRLRDGHRALLRVFGLGRLGFLARTSLVLFLFLLGLLGALAALDMAAADRRTPPAARFPAPEQAAAIVQLLDAAAPGDRETVLRAVRDRFLGAAIVAEPPLSFSERRRMRWLEGLLARYLAELPGRPILAVPGRSDPSRALTERDQVDIAIGLSDGAFLLLEVRGFTQSRLFGMPVGLLMGAAGCLFAALAYLAIAREARPLRALSRSVQAFATDGLPRPEPPRGAPEIRALIEASNAMQARIAGLLRGRTVLLGAVSHDLKTYLTRLRLRIEALPSEEQRDHGAADLETMDRLLADALAVARGAEAGARRERLDLVALLRQEIAATGEARVALTAPAALAIQGDPAALRRLFANLIANALRFGDQVAVAATAEAGVAAVLVDDDGPGVPPERREEMFEPFARLEASRSRETGGAGLGLAIAREIAQGHGGAIDLSEAPLGGARLRVSLPLDPAG